jgi:hypothetical protein
VFKQCRSVSVVDEGLWLFLKFDDCLLDLLSGAFLPMAEPGFVLLPVYSNDRSKKKLFPVKQTDDGIKTLYDSGI